MATHDYVIDNSTGANVRADINNVLQAVLTNNSNSSSPSTTAAYMLWVDTTANIVKIRNSSNNAWINLFTTAGGVDVDAASIFNEDVTFNGASYNLVWDRSDNALEFADNAQARFGSGADFRILHDASNTFLQNDTGNLVLAANRGGDVGGQIWIDALNGERAAKFYANAQVELFYNGTKRFETLSTGAKVTGQLNFDDGSSSANTNGIGLGSSQDTRIFHDGASLQIRNSTGQIGIITPTGFKISADGSNDTMFHALQDGAVQLYQDNVLRLSTETTGVRINVAGNSGLRLDGTVADVDPRIVFRRHSNDGNNAEPAAIQMTYVAGTTYESGHLSFFTNGDSGSAGLTEKFRIQNDGVKYMDNVFNSTANNQRKSYFNNTGQQYHGRNAHEAYIVFQDVSGTQIGSIARTTNNVAYNTSSDYRLKENVSGLSDGITRIKQLKPSRFNFISEPDITMDGFIAHEVSSIVPEAINGEKDAVITQAMLDADTLEGTVGDPIYQGIDQSKLVPLLVAAVQELITKVETLEAA